MTVDGPWARPHIRLPAAKRKLLSSSPFRREYMSVNFPAKGWVAAVATRYAVASQARSGRESNSVAMDDPSVAIRLASE